MTSTMGAGNLLTGAIDQDSKDKLMLLIQSGADVNEHQGGETAAEYAAGFSDFDFVGIILLIMAMTINCRVS